VFAPVLSEAELVGGQHDRLVGGTEEAALPDFAAPAGQDMVAFGGDDERPVRTIDGGRKAGAIVQVGAIGKDVNLQSLDAPEIRRDGVAHRAALAEERVVRRAGLAPDPLRGEVLVDEDAHGFHFTRRRSWGIL
jgi:hypothetical protein